MDNLEKLFEARLKRIEELENAIDILSKKNEILPELRILAKQNVSMHLLTNQIKDLISLSKDEQITRYKIVLKKLQKQQLIFLKLIELADGLKPVEKHAEKENVRPLNGLSVKTSLNVLSSEKREIPRMFLNEFQNSPFVKKMKPLALNFLDFDVRLTQKQFDIIPKYMRGRETLDELNFFLENVIIKCFNEKHSLMYKTREAVKAADKNLWNVYRHQMNYFPERKFITQGDVSRTLDRLIDKKNNTRIQMLKHLGILKEERKESTICYIWNHNI